MKKNHPIKEIVKLQKKGIPLGIFSVCSANGYVLEASMKRALELNTHVLIEATANQVNQFGGYTGMTPEDFVTFVKRIAQKVEFPFEKIILGGDHLGPLTWKDKNEEEAMREAEVLIHDFVMAGFTKIHLDTSMKLKDDPDGVLAVDVIARRGARLASIAENAYDSLKQVMPSAMEVVYVIGSEVPIPGGASEEETVAVTRPEDFEETVESFRRAFEDLNLERAWSNTVAVVVQPGVEFSDSSIVEYDRYKASRLVQAMKKHQNLIFEGHSTDYQTPRNLKAMVEDGIGILKVGPGLTFAFREALFALEAIEMELISQEDKRSNLKNSLEQVMLNNPKNWANHYHGDEREMKLARKYSFSDRARYYMGMEEVESAIETLVENLRGKGIPLSLLSQFVPVQYQKIRKNLIDNDPYEIILDGIVHGLDEYYYAVFPDTLTTIKHNFG